MIPDRHKHLRLNEDNPFFPLTQHKFPDKDNDEIAPNLASHSSHDDDFYFQPAPFHEYNIDNDNINDNIDNADDDNLEQDLDPGQSVPEDTPAPPDPPCSRFGTTIPSPSPNKWHSPSSTSSNKRS